MHLLTQDKKVTLHLFTKSMYLTRRLLYTRHNTFIFGQKILRTRTNFCSTENKMHIHKSRRALCHNQQNQIVPTCIYGQASSKEPSSKDFGHRKFVCCREFGYRREFGCCRARVRKFGCCREFAVVVSLAVVESLADCCCCFLSPRFPEEFVHTI